MKKWHIILLATLLLPNISYGAGVSFGPTLGKVVTANQNTPYEILIDHALNEYLYGHPNRKTQLIIGIGNDDSKRACFFDDRGNQNGQNPVTGSNYRFNFTTPSTDGDYSVWVKRVHEFDCTDALLATHGGDGEHAFTLRITLPAGPCPAESASNVMWPEIIYPTPPAASMSNVSKANWSPTSSLGEPRCDLDSVTPDELFRPCFYHGWGDVKQGCYNGVSTHPRSGSEVFMMWEMD